jgi:transposase
MRAAPLGLRDGDRQRFTASKRSSTVQAGLAQRARPVLLALDGASHTEIAGRLDVSQQTVITSRQRYESRGLAGLEDEPRSGRPRTIDHDRIITATLTPPPKRLGVTHWSSRLLAAKLKIDHATVARAWKNYGVQPWRSQTFKFSTDPELIAKVHDVVGLYQAPPEDAFALSVDEKSQIQALERTAPILPLQPELPEKRTHDYFRHGTSPLFAALEVATGKVTPACRPRRQPCNNLRNATLARTRFIGRVKDLTGNPVIRLSKSVFQAYRWLPTVCCEHLPVVTVAASDPLRGTEVIASL